MPQATGSRPRLPREEPRTGPSGERVDEQMQFVDQAVREHRLDQRSAAGDVEVADLVVQAADHVGVVEPDDLRVLPDRSRERPGDDVCGAPGSSSTVRADQDGSNIS